MQELADFTVIEIAKNQTPVRLHPLCICKWDSCPHGVCSFSSIHLYGINAV